VPYTDEQLYDLYLMCKTRGNEIDFTKLLTSLYIYSVKVIMAKKLFNLASKEEIRNR